MSLDDAAPSRPAPGPWPERLVAPARLWELPADEDGALWIGIDTASWLGGVALWRNGQVLAERTWRGGLNHTAQVVPALIDLLAAVGLRQNPATHWLPDHGGAALAGVVASTGPGSFTGLRVGLAFAKALAIARGARLVGVPGLDALAYQLAAVVGARRGTEVCAVSDAGRGNLYAARYRLHRGELWRVSRYAVVSPRRVCSAAQRCRRADTRGRRVAPEDGPRSDRRPCRPHDRRSPGGRAARPGYLVALGKERAAAASDPAGLEPLYIRRTGPEAAGSILCHRHDGGPQPGQTNGHDDDPSRRRHLHAGANARRRHPGDRRDRARVVRRHVAGRCVSKRNTIEPHAQYLVLRYRPAPGEIVPPLPVRPEQRPSRSRCCPGSTRRCESRTRPARPLWVTPAYG